MPSKYDKPSPNLTVPLVAITVLLTGGAAVVGLPAGWVLFAGMLTVAFAHPAPMLTGPKETPANEREESLIRRHRSWLDTRTSLLLGNAWGFESLWPGIPVRLSYLATVSVGALVAALPLSGRLPSTILETIGSVLTWDAPAITMPWWAALSSGILTHHVLTSLLARRRRIQESPPVTFGWRTLVAMWRSTARPSLLLAPIAAAAGAWTTTLALDVVGQDAHLWRIAAISAGAALGALVVLARPAAGICLGPWRSLRQARTDWEPRFADVFAAKEGTPRLVQRTIADCGAIIDVMDAPPKLMAAGLRERTELLSAAYGDPSTRIDVLGSPNLDAAGQQIPGTAHQLRVRVVQWPEGSFPNLLDPDIDPVSRDLALEAAMARALDAIGVNRMALIEAVQVAELPERADPRIAELAQKREQAVQARIEKLDSEQDEQRAALEAELDEPVTLPRTRLIAGAWRWLRGTGTPQLVTPEDSPLAIWKTTWAMPGIPTPPWQSIQSEYASIAAECSTIIEDQQIEVDAVVERRNGFILVGDPLSNGARYSEASGLDLQTIRNVQAEIEWEHRWEQTLPQGFQPPTTRFEITRDVELPQRFSREPLVLHEQLFATKTGLDAGETYIDPRGKDFEKGMRTSISGAQMVSMVGWPNEKEGPGSRHPHLFVVRWSTQPVPTTPQDVTPAETAAPTATSAPAWVLAHLINAAFRAPNVKLPKPELVQADPLTLPASSKHAWRLTIRLHGGTTLVDVRKKADAIRSQLACPWMRLQEAGDGQITLYVGDPGPGAKLRRGADVEIRRVDCDQAFVDSGIANLSGSVPSLIKISPLETNDEVEVLDFDLPAGIDFTRVKANREKLRSNLNVEFLDVRRRGASGIRIFMAEHDPLPTRVRIPFDRLSDTPAAFGVNALGEPTVFDPKENPHLLVLGGTGSGKSAAISTMLFDLVRCDYLPVIIDPTKGGMDFLFAQSWSIAPFATDVYQAASTMKALYGELEKRKAQNRQHGVVNIDKLPENARPQHIVVVVDEFTSLIGKSTVPPKSDDPAADHARLEAEAENNARAIIGNIVGKLAREARSVGIHLILGTQKLKQDTLNKLPGGEDLKALALDTRIPVPVSERFPTGWARNRDLSIGDQIYARGGQVTRIVKFSPTLTERTTYKVTFDDGQSVVCDAGHLWNVSSENSRKANGPHRNLRSKRAALIAQQLRSVRDSARVGAVATSAELASLSGLPEHKVTTLLRNLGITSFISPRACTIAVPADVAVGTVPALFPVDAVSRALSRELLAAGELATARAIAEEIDGRPVSKGRAGKMSIRLQELGVTRIATSPDRLFDVREFAHRAAEEIERTGTEKGRAPYTTRTTDELHRLGVQERWAVATSAIDGSPQNLPVDPYTLGAWLGDGSMGSGIIAAGTTEACTDLDGVTDQAHLIGHLTAAGFEGHRLACSPLLVGTFGLKAKLRELGVLNHKFIPARYLRASRNQRLALLQGLMDTDGTVSSKGRCVFTQVRAELAAQVAELVRSLGWKAHTWAGTYEGTTRHEVSFKADAPVFRLPRKVAKQSLDVSRTSERIITSIELVDPVPVRCIGVEHPSHEFLVGEFIPTHNTNLARMALGNMTQGDRMSAFRNPLESDPIAEPRVGRGLFEPLAAPHPALMQVWYEENSALKERLIDDGVATPAAGQLIDPEDPRFAVRPLEDFVDVVEETVVPGPPVVEELDLDISFDLAELLDAPSTEEVEGEEEVDAAIEPASVLRLSELSAPTLFAAVEALQDELARTSPSEIVADIVGLDTESEVGATYLELIRELAIAAGIPLREEIPEAAEEVVDPEPPAPEPQPALTAESEDDGFDFDFTAPPVVREGL